MKVSRKKLKKNPTKKVKFLKVVRKQSKGKTKNKFMYKRS